ncbi:MAG: polysaccharide deacetylase family protein [Gemmatimonadaceae bacterium]|nr:polysaccharide deacetylase family protein [Gemmatimonadaceae bacterium]
MDELGSNTGFPGASAAHYKLDQRVFEQHLDILSTSNPAIELTFDDCGASARWIADQLEARGMRGLFFAPTAFIDKRGFCSVDDLRAIRKSGHLIGSHSHTHPIPISALPPQSLLDEWQKSRLCLEDWLGEQVRCASVPGGFLSSSVLDALSAADYTTVFTSEPLRSESKYGELTLIGRYSVTRASSLDELRSVAAGNQWPWIRQRLLWGAKRMVKRIGGRAWLQLREKVFESR